MSSLLGTLIGLTVVGILLGSPATVLLMMFLGNLPIHPSPGFWDCFPGGMLLGLIITSAGKSS
jgi:hypothetical protein